MKEIYYIVGRIIAKRRKELGYNQEYLAEMVHLSRNSISNIERAKKRVQLETLENISIVLNITLSEMFKNYQNSL